MSIIKKKYIEVYGHRGARSFAPENSIPGYKTALAIGVDWVDMDVGITKDGILVVYHDLWLNPDLVSDQNGEFISFITNKDKFFQVNKSDQIVPQAILPYLIHNLTLSELQQYQIGKLNPNSKYGKYFPAQVEVLNTYIPTLQEVIDYVDSKSHKKVGFQIEIKSDPSISKWTATPQEFADKIYQILKKNNLLNRAEIQSFDWEPLYLLQQLDPKIKTSYLVAHNDKERMLSHDPKQAGFYSGGKLLKDYNGSLPQMIKQLGGACYGPEDIALTKNELDEAHKLGLKVVVWTWPEHIGITFDEKLVARLIDWGIDGIITDDPGKLISMLAARGYNVPERYIY